MLNIWNNPKDWAIKKAMFEFLKDRYARNEPIIERLAVTVQTERDAKALMALMVDVYETAYLRAVEDHREQLAKAGLKVNVVGPDRS